MSVAKSVKDLLALGFKTGFITKNHPVMGSLDSSFRIPRVGFLTDETMFHARARISGGLRSRELLDHPIVRSVQNAMRRCF